MSGIGYYYDENGVKQEMEIGPSFDDFPGMAKVTSPIPICHACRKADFDEKGYETLCKVYGKIPSKHLKAKDYNCPYFKAVYKILSALEKAMDYPEFDINDVGSEALGVSEERWARYIEMMVDVGYIKGVSIKRDITGATRINASDVRITLKGLEYLQENSMMKKVYNAVKGIKDITPGL